MLSRSREANSRHFKKSLTVPEQTELVSAKGACEWWCSCLQLVALTLWFFRESCSTVFPCAVLYPLAGVLRNLCV